MKKLFILSLILVDTAYALPKCDGKVEVLKAVDVSEKKALVKWLGEPQRREAFYWSENRDLNEITTYHEDINNDGKREWITADHEGSGSYLSLHRFEEVGSGFTELGDLPWPEGKEKRDGGWYDREDRSFLIKICGQTYYSMQGNLSQEFVGYLWKNGKNRLACDQEWTNYLTSRFQREYDQKNYLVAMNMLEPHFNRCSEKLTSEMKLKILSDLMLTSYHLSDSSKCNNLGNIAKKDSIFAKSKYSKPILHNFELCNSKDATPKKIRIDSKVNLKELNFTDEILVATVPDLSVGTSSPDKRSAAWIKAGIINKDGVPGDHQKYNLRNDVETNVGLGDDNEVVDNRYVAISGCRPHGCGDKGFIWIDTKEGNSVFAINGAYFSNKRQYFAIGSRTLKFSELPKQFWSSFKKWSEKLESMEKRAIYVDGTEKDVSLTEISIKDKL